MVRIGTIALVALAIGAFAMAAEEPPPFRADFRGKPIDEKLFDKENFDEDARTEPEGLLIALGGHNRGATRLRANFAVKGDFEMTFAYELLAGEPVDTQRVGVTMYVNTDRPDNAAFLARFNYRDIGQVYRTTLPRVIGGQRLRPAVDTETTASAGRLRFVRRGPELTCFAAEVGRDEFTKLDSTPDFGPDDLHAIRISAEKDGGPLTKYSARFLELEIRSPKSFAADGSPLFPEPAGNDIKAAPPSVLGPRRSRPLLYLFLGLSVIVLLVIVRRAFRKSPMQDTVANQPGAQP